MQRDRTERTGPPSNFAQSTTDSYAGHSVSHAPGTDPHAKKEGPFKRTLRDGLDGGSHAGISSGDLAQAVEIARKSSATGYNQADQGLGQEAVLKHISTAAQRGVVSSTRSTRQSAPMTASSSEATSGTESAWPGVDTLGTTALQMSFPALHGAIDARTVNASRHEKRPGWSVDTRSEVKDSRATNSEYVHGSQACAPVSAETSKGSLRQLGARKSEGVPEAVRQTHQTHEGGDLDVTYRGLGEALALDLVDVPVVSLIVYHNGPAGLPARIMPTALPHLRRALAPGGRVVLEMVRDKVERGWTEPWTLNSKRYDDEARKSGMTAVSINGCPLGYRLDASRMTQPVIEGWLSRLRLMATLLAPKAEEAAANVRLTADCWEKRLNAPRLRWS